MESPRRILLVEGSGRGFLCHYAHALALGLHDLGQTVMLATGRRDELAGWPTPFAKAALLPDGALSWPALGRAVRAFRPDVVHFQWIGQPLAASVFAAGLRRRGIGSVYTPHNLLPHRRRWLSTPGFQLFYRTVDRVVARDEHLAWSLEEMLGVRSERLVYLPGSPNLMALPGMPGRPAPELPEKRADEVRILYFGHGSPRKGLDRLVAGLEGLPPTAGLHLVVAGEGVLAGVDPQTLARLRSLLRVSVIHRYVPAGEVTDLFRSADLLVMPYVKQCRSPLVDLAGAFGLPVLRSDRVTAARWIEGIHGVTVPAAEPGALAAGLARCLDHGVLGGLREALSREEPVMAAIRRLAAGHLRLYAELGPLPAPLAAPGAMVERSHA